MDTIQILDILKKLVLVAPRYGVRKETQDLIQVLSDQEDFEVAGPSVDFYPKINFALTAFLILCLLLKFSHSLLLKFRSRRSQPKVDLEANTTNIATALPVNNPTDETITSAMGATESGDIKTDPAQDAAIDCKKSPLPPLSKLMNYYQ